MTAQMDGGSIPPGSTKPHIKDVPTPKAEDLTSVRFVGPESVSTFEVRGDELAPSMDTYLNRVPNHKSQAKASSGNSVCRHVTCGVRTADGNGCVVAG